MLGAFAARFQGSEDSAGLSLAEVSARIRSRALTPSQLTQACLARIDVYNPKLNAFITVLRDRAVAQARELDAEQSSGRLRGPLHGIPIALKDNIDTDGIRTTAASAVFDERVPTEDAEVTRRLKAAGAILIGKTNLHEFAMGGTSATSYFGPVRNPWALDRNPGGSSGGSAAAVAAELCFGALGTDTGGSIRIPAAYCGVVGLKPTYGLVSIRGIIPLTLSLDHCGPITRTVNAAIKREETERPLNPELDNTGQFNVYGIPAISVPCGFTSSGLPVGLMIAGPRFSEGKVLALARAFEEATDEQ